MRRLIALLSPLVAIAVVAPAAQAGAGGGSGGFGGGGGGGGGFGGGGYSGGGSGGGPLSAGIIVLLVIAVMIFLTVSAIGAARYNRRRRERAQRVTTASAEAAEDDPVFAADAVAAAAAELYLAAQAAWDARDRTKLATIVGGDLLVEWQRRLDDFDKKHWHNRVTVHGVPKVEYMGLVNRAGDVEDRVVVRICARQDDYIEVEGGGTINKDGATSKLVSVEEWWTLARRDGRWICVSIETEAEGRHHLGDAIVARPDADDERLKDEATVEVAQADAAPATVKTAEIADLDFDGDARAAAMDLALADGRFAPDVLEVAVRRAVAGWAEAIDGEDAALDAVAAPAAARQLLYPGDATHRTRLVVRGPRVKRVHIARLDASSEPARMDVDVDVAGRRYIENRDTADVVSGSKDRDTTFTEHWTLAIDGPKENPWRIVTTR